MGALVGIDEVGRGCWAGPLVAAAVALDDDFIGSRRPDCRLVDSKLLTRRQRQLADIEIRNIAKAIGIGWVSPKQIDEMGLTAAIGLAMRTALAQITVGYERVIIDGNYNFLPGNPKTVTLVRADKTVPAVSAASIIAKVARDNYMIEAGRIYGAYEFEKHVGYGTRLHRELLRHHGACKLHRRSYKPVMEVL